MEMRSDVARDRGVAFLALCLHRTDRLSCSGLSHCLRRNGMDADTLEILRMRYKAAYDAYQDRARHVSKKLESGAIPTVAEIAEEATALEALTKSRQELFDALAKIGR